MMKQNLTKKFVSAIFGVFGIFSIITSSKITGAVIGAEEKDYYWIFGILLIIIAIFIFISSIEKHK